MPAADVILASASPRRQELLSLIFNKFRIVPSGFDEAGLNSVCEPIDHVTSSALEKTRDVAHKFPEALVIAADTVVVVDGAILGKPADSGDAAGMLRRLSGRTHQVYTGVAVARGGMERCECECTDVTFRPLSDEMISRYVSSGEPMDKAGAYAIQGKGAVLVASIRGCYFNVVGLPLYRLCTMLEEFGVAALEI